MRAFRLAALILVAALVVLLAAPLALAQEAQSSATEAGGGSSVPRALDYLKARQQSDGGFAEPGGKSTDELTAWTMCGVCASGEDITKWKKSGRSPLDFLAADAGNLSKLTEIEKTCLAVCSAGGDPRSFGGRNLVDEISERMATDGHIGDMTNEHSWGVIALAAAGVKLPEGSRTWLAARQNIDGGFGYGSGAASEPDDTGAALQALIAAGDSNTSNAVTRALSYLHFCQADDGGFTYQARESNVGSTAWAVQGISAAGQDASSSAWASSAGKTPFDYFASMQQSDGHFRYMTSVDTNLAWMTAETIPALYKKAYPYNVTAASSQSGDTTSKGSDTTQGNSTTQAQSGNNKSTSSGDSTASGSTAPGATAAPDGSTKSNSGSSKNRDGTSGGLASSERGTGSSQGPGGLQTTSGGSSLTVFLIVCAVYMGILGLAYLSLSLLLKSRS
jgi:iron complex transport system substrate-binding protein